MLTEREAGVFGPRVCLTVYCGAVNSEGRGGGPVRTDEGGNYIRKRKERAVGELNARDPREDAEVTRREEIDAEPEPCLCDSSEELAVSQHTSCNRWALSAAGEVEGGGGGGKTPYYWGGGGGGGGGPRGPP